MEIAEGRRERGGERELLFSAEGKRSESLVDLRLSTFSLRGKRIWGRILKGWNEKWQDCSHFDILRDTRNEWEMNGREWRERGTMRSVKGRKWKQLGIYPQQREKLALITQQLVQEYQWISHFYLFQCTVSVLWSGESISSLPSLHHWISLFQGRTIWSVHSKYHKRKIFMQYPPPSPSELTCNRGAMGGGSVKLIACNSSITIHGHSLLFFHTGTHSSPPHGSTIQLVIRIETIFFVRPLH